MTVPLDTHEPGHTMVDAPRRQRLILIAVSIALMAVVASVTGLNVAQPDLAIEFDASQSTVLWFINLYTLTLAALLLPLGAAGDRWGRRTMMLAGLTIFGVASAMAGLAGSATMMLAARFLSGVGAAMIMPVTLAVITSTFPDEERSRAIGVWTAVAGGGGILGMYLSATLVDLVSWRWLFLLPVVLVIVAGALSVLAVPDSREHTQDRFDIGGSLTSIVAVVSTIMFLHEGPESGWRAVVTLALLAVGLVSAGAFIAWERRQSNPLLDVRLFRDRRLAAGSVALLVVFGVQAGIFVVLFPYFQVILGWSGLRSTVALMPMALLMMGASGGAPLVAERIGPRLTMVAGIALSITGLSQIAAFVTVNSGYMTILPGMMLMGLGMGLTMTPSTEAITSALPTERQGVASALNDVTREFGTALGIALLGAVLAAGYAAAIEPSLAGVPADLAVPVREGVATAVAAASATTDGSALIEQARTAFVDGWSQAMWAGVAILALLLLFVAARGPRSQPIGSNTAAAGTSSRDAPSSTTRAQPHRERAETGPSRRQRFSRR